MTRGNSSFSVSYLMGAGNASGQSADASTTTAEIETKIRELKWDYGVDGFAQKRFFATEAAFRLMCVTCNLISLLQEKIGQQGYQTLGTLWAHLLTCGAVVGSDGRKTVLRLSLAGPWRERFERALKAFFPTTEVNCAAVGAG